MGDPSALLRGALLRLEQPVVVVRRRRGFESALSASFLDMLRERTPDLRSD